MKFHQTKIPKCLKFCANINKKKTKKKKSKLPSSRHVVVTKRGFSWRLREEEGVSLVSVIPLGLSGSGGVVG